MTGERLRLVSVVAFLACFTVLAFLANRRAHLPGDVRLTLWVQGWQWSGLDHLALITNRGLNGTPLTLGGVAVVVCFLVMKWRVEAVVLAAAIVIRALNTVFKKMLESPRPTSELVAVTDPSVHFGFPSGHAVGAVLVLGAAAWSLSRHCASQWLRFAIWFCAVAVMLQTGIGRVRVGVHWPSDVLGAWLWGTAALLVLTGLATRWERRAR